MSKQEERRKQRLGDSVVRFMAKSYGVEVVVLDSETAGLGVEVLRTDGARLSRDQERGLSQFLRGYGVFGGPRKGKK